MRPTYTISAKVAGVELAIDMRRSTVKAASELEQMATRLGEVASTLGGFGEPPAHSPGNDPFAGPDGSPSVVVHCDCDEAPNSLDATDHARSCHFRVAMAMLRA